MFSVAANRTDLSLALNNFGWDFVLVDYGLFSHFQESPRCPVVGPGRSQMGSCGADKAWKMEGVHAALL